MIDDDDRGREVRPQHDARPHHMVESDGELLDIGPDAEPIDDPSVRSAERVDLHDGEARREGHATPRPRTAPRFGSAGSGGAEFEPGPDRP